MIRTRYVKYQSLDLGLAVFFCWLGLSDSETERPGEMVLHHLARALTQRCRGRAGLIMVIVSGERIFLLGCQFLLPLLR